MDTKVTDNVSRLATMVTMEQRIMNLELITLALVADVQRILPVVNNQGDVVKQIADTLQKTAATLDNVVDIIERTTDSRVRTPAADKPAPSEPETLDHPRPIKPPTVDH